MNAVYRTDHVQRAIAFAKMAHTGQVRKYTGDPYYVHPDSVASIVMRSPDHGRDPDVVAAAFLHDVLEDTEATYAELMMWFNHRTAEYVREVTDVSRKIDGNRAARKKIDRDHVAKASPQGKTIKLADLIDNTRSIVRHDPDFAKVYLKEKRLTLGVLKEGCPVLVDHAWTALIQAEKELGQ